jgi:NitT/TauT family transport system substrate-binding protein
MKNKATILLAMTIAIALILTGCGTRKNKTSEATGGTPTPSGTSASANTGNSKTTKVTLAIATKDLNIGYPFATLPLAMGWYKEEGLDVDVVLGNSSAGTIQLLMSGKANLGVLVPDTAIMSTINEKTPIKSLYPVSRLNGYDFIVKSDSKIQKVDDLKGKTIGQPDLGAGTVPYSHARYKEAGFKTEDVKEIAVGYGAQAFEALKNGTIDAYVTFTSGYANSVASGYNFHKLPLADWQTNMYNYNLYATTDYTGANSEIVKKIGRAFAKATVFLQANPEAAVRIFWDQYPERAPKDKNDPKALSADLEILKGQMFDMRIGELPVDFKWGSQTLDTWKFQQQYLFDNGLIKTQKDPSVFYDDSFKNAYTEFDVKAIVQQAKSWKAKK